MPPGRNFDAWREDAEGAVERVIALLSDSSRAHRLINRREIVQAIDGTLDLRAPAREAVSPRGEKVA